MEYKLPQITTGMAQSLDVRRLLSCYDTNTYQPMEEYPSVSSPTLPWMIVSSLKAIYGEGFVLLTSVQLPSRRNEVYKITGSTPSQTAPSTIVVKFYNQPGIANETSVLQEAHQKQVPVPRILGSTSDILVLEYIPGPNLCDLITLKPDPLFGDLLASWFAIYHAAFHSGGTQVLTKGDARTRNFLVQTNQLVGVDFEESQPGTYHDDLADTCASILDTKPLFSEPKLQMCQIILKRYASLRQIQNLAQFKSEVTQRMKNILRKTANRRGNPKDLEACIKRFEADRYSL